MNSLFCHTINNLSTGLLVQYLETKCEPENKIPIFKNQLVEYTIIREIAYQERSNLHAVFAIILYDINFCIYGMKLVFTRWPQVASKSLYT